MPIFSFIEHTLAELFWKTNKCWKIYKQLRETFYTSRTCSRNIKCLGIRCIIESALFEKEKKKKKKKCFLIWIKHSKQFPVKGDLISICPSGLSCPSALFSKKGALLLKWKAFFWEEIDSILLF